MCVCVRGSISVWVYGCVCVCGSVCLALTGRRQSMPDYVVVAVVLDVVAAANCAACVAYADVQIAHAIYVYIWQSHVDMYCLPGPLIYLRITLFGFTGRMTICKYVFNWFVIIIVAVLIVFAIVPAIVFLLLLQLYSHIYSYEAISVYSPTILLFV